MSENGGATVESNTSVAKEQGLSKYYGGYTMVKDPETGVVRAVADKPGNPYGEVSSPFSTGEGSAYNKQYVTSDYATKTWQGNKEHSLKRWRNENQDYEHSPAFVRQNSHYSAMSADEGGAVYSQTSPYQTAAAREQGSQRLDKTANYAVEKRRQVYAQPEIVEQGDYGQGRSGRTVEDVKQLLDE